MATAKLKTSVSIKNILFLTDFSEASEGALSVALSVARRYGAKVHAFHVLIPIPYMYTTPELTAATIEAEDECARSAMLQVDSQLAGVDHETAVLRGAGVWETVDQAIRERKIDLVVLGTRGRTGADRLLEGSMAEEIFRRSPVPALTVGPDAVYNVHKGGRFARVLFATDFTPASQAAAPYAVSIAEANQAQLIVLHVIRRPDDLTGEEANQCEVIVADAMHSLYEAVPSDAQLHAPLEALVGYGEAGERIVATAKERKVDLIVLGVREARHHMGAATHLERPIAHKVVSHAPCPVLTVRSVD